MDSVTISLFAVLEVAMFLGIAVFVLWRRNTRLHRQVRALKEQVTDAPEGFASVESGYLAYLEEQILDTRARLELSESEAGSGTSLPDALNQRLVLLEAERTVAGLCNDYPERRWEHVAEHFQPDIPEPDVPEALPQEPEPAQIQPDENPVQSVEGLQDVLGEQGKVIQSLVRVVAQGKQDPGPDLVHELEGQILELERHYREASTCIEIMRQENERLQNKVDRKDQRIDRTEAQMNESVADLQEQLGKQQRNMAELHELVGGLQLEAEKAVELQAKLEQFDLASRDMNMCIQVLEEENEFLQAQVRSLLQLDEGDSVYQKEELENRIAESEQQVAELESRLEDSRRKIREWEEKYASMEQEYLTLYEEANS